MFLRTAAGDAVRTMRALIVDDQASIRSVISKVLSRAGAACEMAGSGEEALERLARAPYDMVFIDLALPGMDGLALARITAHRYPDVPMVMITGSAKFETAVAAMQTGAVDYVAKPFSAQTLTAAFERAASHRRVRLQAARAHSFHQAITERTLEIRMLLSQPVESADALAKGFVAALAMRSAGMAAHVERVADLSRRIAAVLQLPAHEIDIVSRTALLHDVGKLVLPASLLDRQDRLTDEEIAVLRRHPELGYDVVSQVPALSDCADAVLAQLERHDGTGWPQGLRGERIPMAARVVAVANAFDVMTHPRPQGPQQTMEQALQELDACAGTQFDPLVVRALFAALGVQPPASDWEAAEG
ncbi:MAG TPA: HD domain-containing phosphohydrolase [Vicinamibacterales bacterium]